MAGITPPNFTQIPNEILDKMADMTPAEFKVLMAICRKTFGWQKERDVISLSQLEELTGLSRTAVQAGIMAAIKRGMLERTKAGTQSFSYHLLVASDYQSTQTTSSKNGTEPVASSYQELVASDYTQKKDLNKKHSGGDTRARATTSQREAPTPPPLGPQQDESSAAWLKSLDYYPSQIAAALAKHPVFTLEERTRCESWIKRQNFPKAHVSLHKQYLILGKIPDAPPSAKRMDAAAAAIEAERLQGLARWERENARGY